MKCIFTFAVAAAFAVGMNATLWSQTGGTGGASAAGSAGTGTGAASASTAGTAGAAGTANTAGTAANTGTAGTAGATNRPAAAGNAGVGTSGTPGVGRGTVGAAGAVRANASNGAINANAAARRNFDGYGQDFLYPNQTPFFTDPGVRQQLNLNNTQFNTLNRAYQDAYARFQQSVNNLSPALTPEQRELQIQQLQAQFNQSFATPLNSTLTNRQTAARFNQLNRQFMGSNSFNDPAVRQQLNLTADQVRQLRTLQNNWRQQLQQFRRGAGNDLSSVDANRWNQMWQQSVTQLNNVLTPEQQQIWSQMVGQPYTFSPNVFMNQQSPDGNVNVTPPVGAGAPGNQRNAAGITTNPGVQNPISTPAANATQTPTGTQPPTQGTTAPATASGTATQGGTVR